MRKWGALLLVLILITTCSFSAIKVSEFTDQYGNRCFLYTRPSDDALGNSYSVHLNSLPYTFDYNDKEITLLHIGTYQTIINHEYYPFIHYKFDVSQLTDDEIYWLSKDNTVPTLTLDLNPLFIIVNTTRTKVKLLKNNVKELDIVLGLKNGSPTSYKGTEFAGIMYIKHSNPAATWNHYTINTTSLGLYSRPFTPDDLSNMEFRTYRDLKNSLSKKGLEL